MFKTISSMVIAVLGLSFGIIAQSVVPDSGTARLESRRADKQSGEDNYIYATYSFEKAANGPSGFAATRNDWDILFSTIRAADGKVVKDIFDVTMVTDDRSRILDLGENQLTQVFDLPPLPAFEKPGRERSVEAVIGHVYLVHTADSNSDLYTLFRLDELKRGESAVISWKHIEPPISK